PDGTEFSGWRDREQADAPRPGAPGPHIYYRQEADQFGHSSLSLKLAEGKGELLMDPGTYTFSFRPIPLTSTPPPRRHDITSYFSPREHAATTFSIQPGKITEVKAMAPRSSAVTIRVVATDGAAVPGVNVAAFRWDQSTQRYSGTWGTA